MDEPFGRQPGPVAVTFEGELEDVKYWMGIFARRAEFKGDLVQRYTDKIVIYPRAVND